MQDKLRELIAKWRVGADSIRVDRRFGNKAATDEKCLRLCADELEAALTPAERTVFDEEAIRLATHLLAVTPPQWQYKEICQQANRVLAAPPNREQAGAQAKVGDEVGVRGKVVFIYKDGILQVELPQREPPPSGMMPKREFIFIAPSSVVATPPVAQPATAKPGGTIGLDAGDTKREELVCRLHDVYYDPENKRCVICELRADQAAQPEGLREALHEARKALHCLHIAVEPSIARDVHEKVEAAFAALSTASARTAPLAMCVSCNHPLTDNSHGFDQNDAHMKGDKLVHYGHCTYCKYCQSELAPQQPVQPARKP